MNMRVDANPPGGLATSLSPGQSGTPQAGVYQGQGVQVDTADSVIGSAAEEISFAAAENVEKKTHGERKIEGSTRRDAMHVDKINKYLDDAKQSESKKDMEALARRMLRDAKQDPGQLARNSQSFRSPTEQYLVLQMARQLGAAEGAPQAKLEQLYDALGDLEVWYGKAIEADLATIGQAADYGRNAQEVRNFQGSVHVVLGKPSLSQALQEILKLAGQGGTRLEAAMDNLMGAMGSLLSATRSAAEKVLLESLMTDLYHMKSLKTLLAQSKSLLKSLARQKALSGGGKRRRDPEEPLDADR